MKEDASAQKKWDISQLNQCKGKQGKQGLDCLDCYMLPAPYSSLGSNNQQKERSHFNTKCLGSVSSYNRNSSHSVLIYLVFEQKCQPRSFFPTWFYFIYTDCYYSYSKTSILWNGKSTRIQVFQLSKLIYLKILITEYFSTLQNYQFGRN